MIQAPRKILKTISISMSQSKRRKDSLPKFLLNLNLQKVQNLNLKIKRFKKRIKCKRLIKISLFRREFNTNMKKITMKIF